MVSAFWGRISISQDIILVFFLSAVHDFFLSAVLLCSMNFKALIHQAELNHSESIRLKLWILVINQIFKHFCFLGVVCTIFTQQTLQVNRSDPYTITIEAYNPDQPDLVGDNTATLRVFVTLDECVVVIEPTEYNVMELVGDINSGDEVVKILTNSSFCGENGIEFNITQQTLTPSKLLLC